MAKELGPRDFVQSLARGLAVLQSFDGNHPKLTAAQVAQRTGLTRAGVRRLLYTLVSLGHVATDGRLYWLRPQVLSLGYPFLTSLPWWRVAQPVLEAASREMHESCNTSVLDGVDITYVMCVAGVEALSVNMSIGSRLPAYVTAAGRVLLASLSEPDLMAFFAKAKLKRITGKTVTQEEALRKILAQVRRDGFCLVEEEFELGLRTLSVPLIGRSGQTLAAISMNRRANAATRAEMLKRYLPALKKAQANIQATIDH